MISKHIFSPQKQVPQCWIIVASKDHVTKAVAGGFLQANHGKRAPLQRMKIGDLVVFYSPRLEFNREAICRRFTAVGRISDDKVYQGIMSASFAPYRRNVQFLKCEEVPIEPLINSLTFIKDKKRWGYPFRPGLLEISSDDFLRIAAAMSVAVKEQLIA